MYNELSKLIQEAKQRLNYTRLFYPALIVNFIRAHGLIQRGNAVIDDVTGSNVFLGDVNKLKSINRIRTPLKKSLDNMLVEYRRNTHFLDGLEVDFKNFLITRSAGFEGALDINVSITNWLKFEKYIYFLKKIFSLFRWPETTQSYHL